MSKSVGIVGAGVVGSLMAWRLARAGWRVSLFDKQAPPFRNCSWAAAGLLDSVGALEDAEPLISELAADSLEMWPELLGSLAQPVYFQRRGTLALVHPRDREQHVQWLQRIRRLNPDAAVQSVRGGELRALEPEIDPRFIEGLYFPLEGHIDNRELIPALHAHLKHRGVELRFGVTAAGLSENSVETSEGLLSFDRTIDCRGVKAAAPGLRGVRGELLLVHAPDVSLGRPVRLLHPKHAVYVVPRRDHRYVIGATQIEWQDYRGITVRSALELLSAAFAVHSGFAEAEIAETVTQCRPAFSDNKPRIFTRNGVLHVNGLFRHGYLISPKLTQLACQFLEQGSLSEHYRSLTDEELLCA